MQVTFASSEVRDISEAVLASMSEDELRLELRRSRVKVVEHRGRSWRETRSGLFEPLHPMARLTLEQATRPSRFALGSRAVLAESARPLANGSMPLHLLSNLEGYGPHVLSSNRRRHVRLSQGKVRLTQVVGIEPLDAQGYDVFVSSQERTMHPYRSMWEKPRFLAEMQRFLGRPSAVLLAGFVGGRLGGWIAGHAIERTAYVDVVDVATEVMGSHISTALHIAMIEVCQRSPGIQEIAHSLHVPEDRGLTTYKEGMGFPVVKIPTRVELNPVFGALFRWRMPFAHYRFTGRTNTAVAAVSSPDGAHR